MTRPKPRFFVIAPDVNTFLDHLKNCFLTIDDAVYIPEFDVRKRNEIIALHQGEAVSDDCLIGDFAPSEKRILLAQGDA